MLTRFERRTTTPDPDDLVRAEARRTRNELVAPDQSVEGAELR
jgi:hypothetical protein